MCWGCDDVVEGFSLRNSGEPEGRHLDDMGFSQSEKLPHEECNAVFITALQGFS